jgi:hypothetical protein
MKQEKESLSLIQNEVMDRIISIRQKKVITDADVAELYGVETKRINEAVKNNPDKFPDEYMFSLTLDELAILRSKFSTAKWSTKSRALPKVFTEKGLYMLATILKSKRASEVTFAIIETFAKVRYLKKEILDMHENADPNKLQAFGETLADIVMPDLEISETESSLELNASKIRM